ncbi:MAG TPA: hypothetical protein VIS74_02775 [Chthoniobacterales bacterium]
MKLIGFFLKSLLFVGLTFAFLVLFQHGPAHFANHCLAEFDYWQSKIANTASGN